MKTKLIIVALVAIAVFSISASKFSSASEQAVVKPITHSAPIGGLVTDTK